MAKHSGKQPQTQTQKYGFLVQTRVSLSDGKLLKDLSEQEGISVASYLRRLVMRHVQDLRSEKDVAALVP